METLSNSSSTTSRLLSDNLREDSPRHHYQVRFLASWSPSRPRGLNLGSISHHHKATRLHAISGSSEKTQEVLQNEGPQTEDATETVQVRFLLQKECAFGEQFHLVGDDPILGLWDPPSAIPLDWSEGNVWTLELDLPAGKSFQFKFILKGTTGDILWQPGPDRILHTWETKDTIWVSEDWENAELQVVSDKESAASDKLITGETITDPVQVLEEVNEDKASSDNSIIDDFEQEEVSVLTKNVDIGDSALAVNNGSAGTSKAFSGKKDGVNLVTYEGDPILVPGLTVIDTEEAISSETDKATLGNGLSGVEKAKEKDAAELELEKEPDSGNSLHTKASTVTMLTDQEVLPQSKEQVDKMQIATVQDQLNSKPCPNAVLESDIQWGRKTLQKFLANFGSLLHQID